MTDKLNNSSSGSRVSMAAFRHRPPLALAAAIALAASSTAAQAQEQEPAQADTASASESSGDIIVTAQRRSERALDVPASLTVVGEEDFNRGGAASTLDLTAMVPGLRMDRAGTNTYPSIRGITSLVSGPGFDANVATYIDGVYMSSPAAILNVPDVESIVVLKGPQGTLFGRNAAGGAIQVTTKKPSFTPEGKVSIGYGRFNDIQANGFVSLPLISEKLAVSVAGLYQSRDGYLHDVINDKTVGKLESHLVRGKLLVTPVDDVELLLSGYWSYHRDDAQAYGTALRGSSQANLQPGAITPSKPYQSAANIAGTQNEKNYGFDATLQIDVGAGDLKFIGAYNNYKTYRAASSYGGFAPAGGYQLYVSQNNRTYSFEANFTSDRIGIFDFIAGYYYYNDLAGYDPLGIDRDTAIDLALFSYQSSEAHSGFAETNIHLGDRLTATAGIRYNSEKRSLEGQTVFGSIPATRPATPNNLYGEETFSSWTPRFSLRYEVADDTNIYATFSKGFKSGGFDTTSSLGRPAGTVLRPVRPEKVTAYEVGFKSAPTRDIDLSGAVYYYDYKDQQVSAYVTDPVTGAVVATTFNAASSEIYGLELQAGFRVSPEFRFHSALSLIHARFQDFQNAVVLVFNGQNGLRELREDASGNHMPRTPDITVTVGAEYEKAFTSGTLKAKVDLFMSDEAFYEVGNRFSQPAYENVDASLSWTLPNDNWTFTAWGRNLTNRVVTSSTNIGARSALYNWAPPRTYGVSASFKW